MVMRLRLSSASSCLSNDDGMLPPPKGLLLLRWCSVKPLVVLIAGLSILLHG